MHAFEREKEQMQKLITVSAELFEKADLLITRQEERWRDEEQDLQAKERQEQEAQRLAAEAEARAVEQRAREEQERERERQEEERRQKEAAEDAKRQEEERRKAEVERQQLELAKKQQEEAQRLAVGPTHGQGEQAVDAEDSEHPGCQLRRRQAAARADRQDDGERPGSGKDEADEAVGRVERAEVGQEAAPAQVPPSGCEFHASRPVARRPPLRQDTARRKLAINEPYRM